jgi:hypothetical protein
MRLSTVSAGHPLRPARSLVLISIRGRIDPQGHSVAGRITSIEKSNNLIGNRTCDLPAYSKVPQPTTLPRAPKVFEVLNFSRETLWPLVSSKVSWKYQLVQKLKWVKNDHKRVHFLLKGRRKQARRFLWWYANWIHCRNVQNKNSWRSKTEWFVLWFSLFCNYKWQNNLTSETETWRVHTFTILWNVTMEGVWNSNWIYWTLMRTTRNYK